MIRYVFKRLLYGLVVLLGAVIVVFFISNVLPGDPVAMMAGQGTDVETRKMIERELGLDQPLPVQLGIYFNNLSPVSVYKDTEANQKEYEYYKLFAVSEQKALVVKLPYLGKSYQTNRKVSELILSNVGSTFWLAFAAMLFATVVGVMMGVLASLKQNSWLDHSMVAMSVFGISAPSFVIGAVMSMVFGAWLSDYTGLNPSGSLWRYSVYGETLQLKNIILPAITLGLGPLSIITMLTRSSMCEVMAQDYIRTARAKGLPHYLIILKHALKNALNPIITAVSGWLASLMAGAFFVEKIFNWQGIGLATIDAILNLDFPVVMGTTIFVAFIFIIVNILVDILYAAVDPRVRLS